MTCPHKVQSFCLTIVQAISCLIARDPWRQNIGMKGESQPDLLTLQCASFGLSGLCQSGLCRSHTSSFVTDRPQLQCSALQGSQCQEDVLDE